MTFASRPWSRSRIRIRPRRGISPKWTAFLDRAEAGTRPWARLPVALTWRRRPGGGGIKEVRVLSPGASRTPDLARVPDTRYETRHTLTRLVQRHVAFETRMMRTAGLPALQQRGRAVISLRSEPQFSGGRRGVLIRPRLERPRTAVVRPPSSAAAAAPSMSAAVPAARLSATEAIVWSLAPGLRRRNTPSAHGDVPAVGTAPSITIPGFWPARLRRAIVARATGTPSARRRLDSPAATIVRQGDAPSAPPAVSAATAAMAMVPSPALVWRTTRVTASNGSTESHQTSAPSDGSRFTQHAQPSVPSTVLMPAAGTERVRTAMMPLSGPAIDRLAEDVLQRFERRIRIERERRGL